MQTLSSISHASLTYLCARLRQSVPFLNAFVLKIGSVRNQPCPALVGSERSPLGTQASLATLPPEILERILSFVGDQDLPWVKIAMQPGGDDVARRMEELAGRELARRLPTPADSSALVLGRVEQLFARLPMARPADQLAMAHWFRDAIGHWPEPCKQQALHQLLIAVIRQGAGAATGFIERIARSETRLRYELFSLAFELAECCGFARLTDRDIDSLFDGFLQLYSDGADIEDADEAERMKALREKVSALMPQAAWFRRRIATNPYVNRIPFAEARRDYTPRLPANR